MHFAEVAGVSDAVSATPSHLDEIGRLAELLRRLAPDEVAPLVAWLSGAPRQGRIGIGHAAISAASGTPPAEAAALTVADVDARLDALARVAGSGAARERARQVIALFEKATRPEQDFLRRLLYGELRQGALEGVVLEAVARATRRRARSSCSARPSRA